MTINTSAPASKSVQSLPDAGGKARVSNGYRRRAFRERALELLHGARTASATLSALAPGAGRWRCRPPAAVLLENVS